MGSTIAKKLKMIVSIKGAAKVMSSIKKIAEGIFFIGNAAKMAVGFIQRLISPLTNFTKEGIKNNIMLERMNLTLEVVMKSAKKAKDMFAWVRGFAARVPFELQSVLNAATVLETYGLNAKKWMGNIANMAAVMGRDITDASQAIANLLQGEGEMMKRFGATRQTLMKYGWSGLYKDTQQLVVAVNKFMIDKFKDGTIKMAKTWDGVISMFKDKWFSFTAGATSELFESFKDTMNSVNDFLSKYDWEQIGRNFIKNWRLVWDTMKKIMVMSVKLGWTQTIDWLKGEGLALLWGWAKKVLDVMGMITNPAELARRGIKATHGLIKRILFGKDAEKADPIEDYKKEVKRLVSDLFGELSKGAAIVVGGEATGGYFRGGTTGGGGPASDSGEKKRLKKLEEYFQWKQDIYDKAVEDWYTAAEKERDLREKWYQEGVAIYKKELQQIQDMTNYVSQAFVSMFDVISVNANSTEKRVLSSLTAITSAVPQALSLMHKLKLGDITGGMFGFGIAGLGLGLIGTLMGQFKGDKESEESAKEARQERQIRRFGSTTRATPMNVTIAPVVTITGELINLGEDGTVAGGRIFDLLINATQEAVETGEMQGVIGAVI